MEASKYAEWAQHRPGPDPATWYCKYIRFEQVPTPGKKTQVWDVVNRRSEFRLGQIRWFSNWRQYVFCPSNGQTLFNPSCLRDIAQFTEELTRKHKEIHRWGRN